MRGVLRVTAGWRIAVAILLGFAIFPGLLVFPPFYFPWMWLLLLVAGLLIGAVVPWEASRPFAAALALAALTVTVAVLVLARMATSSDALPLLARSARLLVVVGLGAVIAVALARRLGPKTASLVAAAGTVALLVAGTALAQVFAPVQVAGAPDCSGLPRRGTDCQLVSLCAMTAERRRLWTIERIVEFDTSTKSATCTYTAWGGILIGTVRNGGWSDGPIPALLGWP